MTREPRTGWALVAENQDLRTENERLQAEAEHHLQAYQIMFNQTERLQAALKPIVAAFDKGKPPRLEDWDAAHNALEPKP